MNMTRVTIIKRAGSKETLRLKTIEELAETIRVLYVALTRAKDILVLSGTAQDAFKKLQRDNKELVIVPGASHIDLYDNKALIPFDKLAAFFDKNLK